MPLLTRQNMTEKCSQSPKTAINQKILSQLSAVEKNQKRVIAAFQGNKKAFLWTYNRDGYINLNVKTKPEKASAKIGFSAVPSVC